jgi:uncharacterized protein YdaU (DUF1376 family)
MANLAAYLPLYVRDFLSDPKVLSLTWTQQAIHLRLMMASWEAGGPLSRDLQSLCRMIGWKGKKSDVSTVLETCWVERSGLTASPRLECERARTAQVLKRRSDAGKRGNDIRWRSQCDRNAIANGSQSQAQAQAQAQVGDTEPPLTPPAGGRRLRKTDPMPEIPEALKSGGFPELWEVFLAHRRSGKKTFTPEAARLALRKLDGWGVNRAIASLEHSVSNGWSGIFEPEEHTNGHNGHPKPERSRAWNDPK